VAVLFSSYDIFYDLPEKETVQSWIIQVIENNDFNVGDLNYLFCSDKYILEINRKFLSHNYITDIITFDYCTRRMISGDILISVPTVSYNAERFGVTFFNELLRVMIHGVLHLIGYKDSTAEEKEEMRKAEDLCLLFYETNFA
jgi:rRNA maturation RNase YbeY